MTVVHSFYFLALVQSDVRAVVIIMLSEMSCFLSRR